MTESEVGEVAWSTESGVGEVTWSRSVGEVGGVSEVLGRGVVALFGFISARLMLFGFISTRLRLFCFKS